MGQIISGIVIVLILLGVVVFTRRIVPWWIKWQIRLERALYKKMLNSDYVEVPFEKIRLSRLWVASFVWLSRIILLLFASYVSYRVYQDF